MDYTLTLQYDSDAENPSEWGGWKFVPFDSNCIGHENPYDYIKGVNEYGEVIPANIGIGRKLDTGTAFIVSCYQHGGRSWTLRGEGMNCPWDTTSVTGILLWDGKLKDLPKGYQERKDSARSFLKVYTDWAEGNVYGYVLDTKDYDIEDECWGCIGGNQYMFDSIRENFKKGDQVKVKGDASRLAKYRDLSPASVIIIEDDEEEDEEDSE